MSKRVIRKAKNTHVVKPAIPKELNKKRPLTNAKSESNQDRAEDGEQDEEDEDSGEEEYLDYTNKDEEDVQVDFDISIPDMDKDYFGLELYTKNFLNGQAYNYSDLTQIVLGNDEKKEPNQFTSVIKVPYSESKKPEAKEKEEKKESSEVDPSSWEWDSDIYGFLTIIDMNKHKKSESIKQIKEYIMEKCTNKKMKDQLAEVFNGKPALILNERVMNLPFEVGAMLHENLHKEITEAVKEGECPYFKHYIILTRVFYPVSALGNSQKRVKVLPVFTKGEEEFYFNRADLKFKYEITNPYTFDSKSVAIEYAVEHEGVVIVVERSKVEKISKKIAEAREEMQNQTTKQKE